MDTLKFNNKILMKNHTSSELFELLSPLGCDERLARRLQSSVVKRKNPRIEYLIHSKKKVMEKVMECTSVPALSLQEKQTSRIDGFTKYLFKSSDECCFEAVRIPLLYGDGRDRFIVCVSSQAGCSMGCAFCATSNLPFKRNLETWEIVDQVLQVSADSDYPVKGVVFMGMGEPFMNYENVMRAARIFSEPCALAIEGKAISISTVGIAPVIRRFADEHNNFKLIFSMSSADSKKRASLMPAENKWTLADTVDALRYYHDITGKQIYIAWTLIQGFNDSPEDIIKLADLTKGLPIILDLIEINDVSGKYKFPPKNVRDKFVDAIRKHLKMPFSVRYSGGRDIHGACGMLALKTN